MSDQHTKTLNSLCSSLGIHYRDDGKWLYFDITLNGGEIFPHSEVVSIIDELEYMREGMYSRLLA